MAKILDQIRGLADSKWNGIAGSVAECVGLDIHTNPGLTQVQQKLAKESATTVDAFVKNAVTVSTGESFWFSSTSGKIWRRSNASPGIWLLVYTTSAGAGGSGCLGALEYNGFLYWATESRLHRIAMATAHATAANWTSNVALNWATFAVTDASWHPFAIQDLTLFIGDGNQVASVNSSATFDNNALDIKTPLRIKTMIPFDIDMLIGTYVADTVNKTEVIRWDCVSPTWNTSDTIEEVGINAFIRDDNYVYANAGRAGNIYFYDGKNLIPFKKIPGIYSNTKYGTIHPGSVGNFKGIPIFGFSNGLGNPAKQGVYSFGSYSRDYQKVLDLSWVISQAKTASIGIGAIIVADFDIMIAWKDGTTYGVDVIDYTAKYTGAYFETTILFQDERVDNKTIANILVPYHDLPANTAIKIYYKKNNGLYVEITEAVVNSIIRNIETKLSIGDIGSMQIKVAYTVSSNDAPTTEGLDVVLE